MKPLWTVVVFAVVALGPIQAAFAQVSLPSKEEISELANKADQYVSSFEEAVKNAKPWLDKIDARLPTNYLNAVTAGHAIIQGIQKNGPSAYGLVSLLATLDDLSLDAANASVQLVAVASGTPSDGGIVAAVTRLATAGSACNDIAELLLHATLRFIKAEEDALDKLLGNQK